MSSDMDTAALITKIKSSDEVQKQLELREIIDRAVGVVEFSTERNLKVSELSFWKVRRSILAEAREHVPGLEHFVDRLETLDPDTNLKQRIFVLDSKYYLYAFFDDIWNVVAVFCKQMRHSPNQ